MEKDELFRIKDELIESMDERMEDEIEKLPEDADGFHVRALLDLISGGYDYKERFRKAKQDVIDSGIRL